MTQLGMLTLEDMNRRWIGELSTALELPEQIIVPGDGLWMEPLLMLIGEAPGEQETLQRRPFVGKAGSILKGFLDVLGLKREEIYISNVVKVRPTKQGPSGRLSNRAPTREEIQSFLPWLMEEIAAVSPKLLVTLGNTPLQALLGEDARIGRMHGRLTRTAEGKPLYPLYHPAATIYSPELLVDYNRDVLHLKDMLERRKKP